MAHSCSRYLGMQKQTPGTVTLSLTMGDDLYREGVAPHPTALVSWENSLTTRLLAGAPMRASPMTPEQLNAIASALIAIDVWMGVSSPITASLVFNGVTANRRVAASLSKMTRAQGF